MKTYKSSHVLAELRSMTGLVITDKTYASWRRFCFVMPSAKYVNADQFLNLMALAIYKKENGVSQFSKIDDSDLFEIVVKHNLEQRLKMFSNKGTNYADLINNITKKHGFNRQHVRAKIKKLYGKKELYTLSEVREIHKFFTRGR